MAAPDDLKMLELMMDQMEVELTGSGPGINILPEIVALIMDDMRNTATEEAKIAG